MHFVQIHKIISRIISFSYRIGFWHRGDRATVRERRIKLLYCMYYSLFVTSIVVGAIKNQNPDESIFLWEITIIVGVVFVKLCYLTWEHNQILELLNQISVFSIRSHDDLNYVNKKLKRFSYFVILLLVTIIPAGIAELAIIPFIGGTKTLFFKIAFPLDYEKNDYAFWIANTFLVIAVLITMAVMFFSTLIWYLMLNCSLRYEVLASDLRRLGKLDEIKKEKISEKKKHVNFFQDLTAAIDTHLQIKELAQKLESFLSILFFLQIGTSGLGICGSIYCLAINVSDNYLIQIIHVCALVYNIFEIFMITYLGNEILLSSDSLSYSLFESDWVDQPQSTKNCIVVFGEYLKKPQELVVVKLYPLTLTTFTRIVNSAYNMFNILKNMAH